MAVKKAKKKRALAAGAAYTLFETDRDGVHLVEFRDDLVSADGRKKTKIRGKGAESCGLALRLGTYLQKYNVPTSVYGGQGKNGMLVRAAEPFGFSVKVTNFVPKKMAAILGLTAGAPLACPVIEYFYHNEKLKNPGINQYHAVALGLADRDAVERINELALKANAVLKSYLSRRGLNLMDVELDTGTTEDGIVITSPVCLDRCSVSAADGAFTFDRSAFAPDGRKNGAAYRAASSKLER